MKLDPTITARGLVRLWNYFSHHIIGSPGMAHPMQACFEEAYVVMGAGRAAGLLDDARMTAICRRYHERMLAFQGVHWPDMFDMGYGYNRNEAGVVACSCVADNASTASAMLDSVKRFPHLPENPRVLAGVKRYLDHCLENYRTPKGVMGVGVLDHIVNPPALREYWCANALFVGTLVRYGDLTGERAYHEAAVPMVEFIATYDYRHTTWKEWERCAPQQILIYTAEGLVAALASPTLTPLLDVPLAQVISDTPAVDAETLVPAFAPNLVETELTPLTAPPTQSDTVGARLRSRFAEFCAWWHENQLPEGRFEPPPNDHYLCYEPLVAGLLLDAVQRIQPDARLESIAAKQLRFLASPAAKPTYGLFANDFASGMAFVSFTTAAEILRERDPVAWEAALQGVFDREETLW
jgi:hypothetical protein